MCEDKESPVKSKAISNTLRDSIELKDTIYDLIRTIKDPEKPNTLEELEVVYEDGITIKDPTSGIVNVVRIEFNPTIPHCSLATLIGLCIRIKVERNMPCPIKLDIYIKSGAHTTEHETKACNFKTLEDELIRVGIQDGKLSENLQMDNNLTLDKAIERITQSERVKHKNKELRQN
ncbi:hypothetical protein JTB14_021842 [Gonioctena quinquepunctata]|nr:hypothetical protein JTB14_021842 [Gonioctena quinquepunctata]